MPIGEKRRPPNASAHTARANYLTVVMIIISTPNLADIYPYVTPCTSPHLISLLTNTHSLTPETRRRIDRHTHYSTLSNCTLHC